MSDRYDNKSLENHPVIKRYIVYYKKLKELKHFNEKTNYSFLFSILYAPFYTISISRQLSVTPHKEIYGDFVNPNNSKELMKLSNEVTLRDAKNFELIKQSGVIEGQKPYRAPIYDNYWQTIKGLYRQGILGFYKGNFMRLVTAATSQRLSISIHWALKERFDFMNHFHILREWLVMSFCDMVCHIGFVIENRYVLQNRQPQFLIYKNIIQFYKRSHYEIFRAAISHFPKNFLFLFGYYLNVIRKDATYTSSMILGSIFSYPYMTAFRRVVCESTSMPGLLPVRYLNTLHAIFLIRKEEGLFKGLYKGFFAYYIGIMIWCWTVPAIASIQYHKRIIEEDDQMFGNDPVFEEIKKRKIQDLQKSSNF
jgi:hypothetical protein